MPRKLVVTKVIGCSRSSMARGSETARVEGKPGAEALQLLFTPTRVGRIELKNRIIMPPMIDRLAVDGVAGDRVKEFYAARARVVDVGRTAIS